MSPPFLYHYALPSVPEVRIDDSVVNFDLSKPSTSKLSPLYAAIHIEHLTLSGRTVSQKVKTDAIKRAAGPLTPEEYDTHLSDIDWLDTNFPHTRMKRSVMNRIMNGTPILREDFDSSLQGWRLSDKKNGLRHYVDEYRATWTSPKRILTHDLPTAPALNQVWCEEHPLKSEPHHGGEYRTAKESQSSGIESGANSIVANGSVVHDLIEELESLLRIEEGPSREISESPEAEDYKEKQQAFKRMLSSCRSRPGVQPEAVGSARTAYTQDWVRKQAELIEMPDRKCFEEQQGSEDGITETCDQPRLDDTGKTRLAGSE